MRQLFLKCKAKWINRAIVKRNWKLKARRFRVCCKRTLLRIRFCCRKVPDVHVTEDLKGKAYILETIREE